jgi:ABC-2 type transport system permease protein
MKPTRFRWLVQVGTFFRKETLDVLRQPALLFTLVLGPFLIMAIFGIGYRDTAKPMRTVFVVPEGSPLRDDVEQYADEIGEYVDYKGIAVNEGAAMQQLEDGDVDLVVEFPLDPLADVLEGEPAVITVVHTRLDPVEQTAITFASRIAVEQINGEVLARIVGGAQGAIEPAGVLFEEADAAVVALDEAIGTGDEAAAQAAIDQLDEITTRIALSTSLVTTMTERLGADDPAMTERSEQLNNAADDLRRAVAGLDASSTSENVTQVRELLDVVSGDFEEFTSVDPEVLVRPLRSEVRLAVDEVDAVTDWYAPAAVVLVLQQFGIAFGALSFVRERQLGISEVLRVAPVGPTVTLFGKYLSYLLIGSGLAAVLTALVVGLLDVPLQSGLDEVALVMGLTLFASIGVGLLISLVSGGDAQAVQYTMILLLASLFFSGFFLSVNQMEGAALVVSYALPVTYGMQMLRDVMLRGADPDPTLLAGLIAYGVIVFIIVLFGARRRLAGTKT